MREEQPYHVYIMANRSLTPYAGHRALQHKAGEIEGFTKKYHINRLVYYETLKYVNNTLAREKRVTAWTRAKRLALIKTVNPAWQDLAEGWGEPTKLQIPRFARDDKPKEDGKPKENDNGKDIEGGNSALKPRPFPARPRPHNAKTN
jgi:putative endonuclease